MRTANYLGFVLATVISLWATRLVQGQGFDDLLQADRNGSFVEAEPVLIVIPKSRDCVLGYSTLTGEWDKVEFDAPLDEKRSGVVLGGDVAVLVHDGFAHAFSSKTGNWASIKLEDSAEPAIPVVSGNVAAIRHANTMYAFGTKHGVWAKATLSQGSKAQPMVGNSLVKVIDGETMLVFSEASKRFTGVNLTDGETIRVR